MHKHHIVFRSQGGLDFDLNLINLSVEDHEGNNSPHHNRNIDLELKENLQLRLEEIFCNDTYTVDEIAKELGKSKKYIEKHFKRVPTKEGVYPRKEIIKKLMGGKFYV